MTVTLNPSVLIKPLRSPVRAPLPPQSSSTVLVQSIPKAAGGNTVPSTQAEKSITGMKDNALADAIAILDFGSQYSQLIARRVREVNTFSELLPFSISAAELKRLNPKGIILSGGPNSVYDPGAPKCDPEIWKLGVPVLGVCYGMQLMGQELG